MRINKYKCDQCGAEQDAWTYGGKPFMPQILDGKRMDFCDEECLLSFLEKRLRSNDERLSPTETTPATPNSVEFHQIKATPKDSIL